MPRSQIAPPSADTQIRHAEVAAIALIPVTSSQLAAVGYDPETGELVIKFHGTSRHQHAIYSYAGVPPELAAGLLAAESPGAFFHRHIRQGPFPYRRHRRGGLLDGASSAEEDR
jgi:hypothetical protein